MRNSEERLRIFNENEIAFMKSQKMPTTELELLELADPLFTMAAEKCREGGFERSSATCNGLCSLLHFIFNNGDLLFKDFDKHKFADIRYDLGKKITSVVERENTKLLEEREGKDHEYRSLSDYSLYFDYYLFDSGEDTRSLESRNELISLLKKEL